MIPGSRLLLKHLVEVPTQRQRLIHRETNSRAFERLAVEFEDHAGALPHCDTPDACPQRLPPPLSGRGGHNSWLYGQKASMTSDDEDGLGAPPAEEPLVIPGNKWLDALWTVLMAAGMGFAGYTLYVDSLWLGALLGVPTTFGLAVFGTSFRLRFGGSRQDGERFAGWLVTTTLLALGAVLAVRYLK